MNKLIILNKNVIFIYLKYLQIFLFNASGYRGFHEITQKMYVVFRFQKCIFEC